MPDNESMSLLGRIIKAISPSAYHHLKIVKLAGAAQRSDTLSNAQFSALYDLSMRHIEDAFEYFSDKGDENSAATALFAKASFLLDNGPRKSGTRGAQYYVEALSLLKGIAPIFERQGDKSIVAGCQVLTAKCVVGTTVGRFREQDFRNLITVSDQIAAAVVFFESSGESYKLFHALSTQGLVLCTIGERTHGQDQLDAKQAAIDALRKAFNAFSSLPKLARNSIFLRPERRQLKLLLANTLLSYCISDLIRSDPQDHLETLTGYLSQAASLMSEVKDGFGASKDSPLHSVVHDLHGEIFYESVPYLSGNDRGMAAQRAIENFQEAILGRSLRSSGGFILKRTKKIALTLCRMGKLDQATTYMLTAMAQAHKAFAAVPSYEERRALLGGFAGLGDLCAIAFMAQDRAPQALHALFVGRSLEDGSHQHHLDRLTAAQQAELAPYFERYLKAQQLHKTLLSDAEAVISGSSIAVEGAKAEFALSQLNGRLNDYLEKRKSFADGVRHPAFPLTVNCSALTEGVAASVIIGMSELGGCVFVVPAGEQELTAEHMLVLPGFSSSDWKALLGDPVNGWAINYDQFANSLPRTQGKSDAQTLTNFSLAIGTTLERTWDMLMGPVDELLTSLSIAPGAKIRIIAPAHIACIPLHAAGQRDQDGRWSCFMDRWRVTYSSMGAGKRSSASSGPNKLLIVTNPTGDLPEPDWSRFGAGNAELVFLRADATVKTVTEQMEDCAFAIFLCHARWDFTDPENTGLILAGGEIMTLKDIRNVRFKNAPTILLACCESGLGNTGDFSYEARSLPEQLIRSGAKAVIATHWPVYLSSATILVETIIENIGDENFSPDALVREFQARMRDGQSPASVTDKNSTRALHSMTGEHGAPPPDTSDQPSHASIIEDTSLPLHWAAFSVFD